MKYNRKLNVKVKISPVPAKKYFMIDAENVALTGITGISNIKGNEIYTFHRNPLSKGVIKELKDAGTIIETIDRSVKKENAADEWIMMHSTNIAVNSGFYKRPAKIFLISKDRDIDKVITYGENHFDKRYVSVRKYASISDYLMKEENIDIFEADRTCGMTEEEFLEFASDKCYMSKSFIDCIHKIFNKNADKNARISKATNILHSVPKKAKKEDCEMFKKFMTEYISKI